MFIILGKVCLPTGQYFSRLKAATAHIVNATMSPLAEDQIPLAGYSHWRGFVIGVGIELNYVNMGELSHVCSRLLPIEQGVIWILMTSLFYLRTAITSSRCP